MKKLRRRYIAFEVKGGLNAGAVRRAVSEAVREITPRPMFILFDRPTGRGLLRCGHIQLGEVKEALARLKMGGAQLTILGVSGTIKTSKRKFLAP